MTTLMATPPKMKTPVVTRQKSISQRPPKSKLLFLCGGGGGSIVVPLCPVIDFHMFRFFLSFLAPFRLPLGISPLVVVQKLPRTSITNFYPSPSTPSRLIKTPATRKPGPVVPSVCGDASPTLGDASPTLGDDRGGHVRGGGRGEDVSSPEAARARCHAIHLDYAGNRIRNPATERRMPAISLQRAVVLSTGQ